ncbi:MAG: DUF3850 domain-containing protein [Candidatus Omnitrophica bacterium]|nr:DUF3850 domain-containing protein [Candidatus Omnitrophota bacterium]
MHHELKIEPAYHDAITKGGKRFEIRYDDRGYQKGDSIVLRAYNRQYSCYDSDREDIEAVINYVSNFRQREGYVVFGFNLVTVHKLKRDE